MSTGQSDVACDGVLIDTREAASGPRPAALANVREVLLSPAVHQDGAEPGDIAFEFLARAAKACKACAETPNDEDRHGRTEQDPPGRDKKQASAQGYAQIGGHPVGEAKQSDGATREP